MTDTILIKALRPLHFRRVAHAVHPAPISRPRLRTGKLSCGHPFVDEGVLGKRVLLKCCRCAGEPTSSELWTALDDILRKPQEILPTAEKEETEDEEPETRPVIRTRVAADYVPPPNEVILCSLCGGRPTVKMCLECKGTKSKWRYGPRVYPKQRIVLFERPSFDTLEGWGFTRSGRTAEGAEEKYVGLLARAWMRAVDPREKQAWEGVLAHHGWFRRPLSMEEMLRKYPPRVREEEPEKVKQDKVPHWSTPGKKFTKLRPKRGSS